MKVFNGIALKMLAIAFVMVVLFIGLLFISIQLSTREDSYMHAIETIQESAGGNFYLSGPYIRVPVIHSWYTETTINDVVKEEHHSVKEYVNIQAEKLYAKSNISSEIKTLGIYSAPIFEGSLNINSEFNISLTDNSSYKYLLDEAIIYFKTDIQNLKGRPIFIINGSEYNTDSIVQDNFSGIGVTYPLKSGINNVNVDAMIHGANYFSILPSGRDTKLELESDWVSPGFTDFAYLPDYHEIGEYGFTATWNIPFTKALSEKEISDDYPSKSNCIGFSLVQPVNLYQKLHRAVNYGFLFIAVPFIIFFLFEIFTKITFHPMHYLLSGAACVIFFLLLLSLSEHFSFLFSYISGATAVTILTSWFIATVVHKFLFGVILVPIFISLYSYLYFSLISEDYALLIGSIFAFIILAIIMICTKNVDWSNLGSKKKSETDNL